MEDGSPCNVYCAGDHPDADGATVEIGSNRFDFEPIKIGGELRWDYKMDQLIRSLQAAFDQGCAHQRVTIRDTLREVIGI